jgi:hypothetical protein
MAACHIDTLNVKPLPARERLAASRIFSETKHVYDCHFWKNFNIILPEEVLEESILQNINNILITEE